MSDPKPDRTVVGCLNSARSGGMHPCQSAIDADLLIKRLTDENGRLRRRLLSLADDLGPPYTDLAEEIREDLSTASTDQPE